MQSAPNAHPIMPVRCTQTFNAIVVEVWNASLCKWKFQKSPMYKSILLKSYYQEHVLNAQIKLAIINYDTTKITSHCS